MSVSAPLRYRHLLLACAMIAMILLLAWAGSRWATGQARASADAVARQTARAHVGLLNSELQKFRLLPLVLSENPEIAPALRGGDEGWDISGKQQESNYLDGKKTTFSALIGEAPPVPTRQKKTEQKEEDASTSKAPSTPEELEKRTKSTLVEYMSSADIAEAMLCIKEFNCDEGQAAKVVELVIAQLPDNVKENEKNLLLELLVALRTREAVSADALLNGLKAHTATLEDLAIDVPLAPQLIGESIGACVTGGAADLSLLKTILDGCEGCEVKRKFVLVVLLKMRQKGKDVKAELAEHGLDLAVALKADELDPPDLPTVEDFLAKKGLSSLLA